ncbi:hypothetical protein ABPG74_012200 [Tetrahymena malaccensis]
MPQTLKCQQLYTYPFPDKIQVQQYSLDQKNTNITISFKLKTCPSTKRQLLISNLNLDLYKKQDGFKIDQQSISDTSVTFNIYKNSYIISFSLAEICIETFYVDKISINNVTFDKNGLFVHRVENPQNFNENMVLFPYIIGVISEYYQFLFIQEVQTQNDGFLITFISSNYAQFAEIIINYIYYDEANNPYYQIFQFIDTKYQQIQQPHIMFKEQSDFYINPKFKCEQKICNNYSMIGITGYQQNINANLRQAMSINILQQNYIQINYSTWADSILQGIQSQFLLFQMVVCQNGQANFRDKCQECPSGFFLQKDQSTNLNICVSCDSSCLTCQLSSSNCTSCSQENPYFVKELNKCQQQYPNQYYCEQNQTYSIQYDCIKCLNCPQCSSLVECCNSNLFKFNINNQKCECFDQQMMVYDINPQKCSCADETTMVNNVKNCTCKDTSYMKYNQNEQKCDCLDLETMFFDNFQCICKDEPKMTFKKQLNKCVCNETMQFNRTTSKCDCIDYSNMIYNQQNKVCECLPNMIYNQNVKLCVCENSSHYFDQFQKMCLSNPAQKNCEILENFLPSCNKCLSGFQKKQGRCYYCGNGKFFDENTNLCSQQCQDYCFLCANKKTCYQFNDEFPCHYSCQLCSQPNSSQSCSLCSSSTRQFSSKDNSCNCKYGYEETNKTDCIQIVQSYSQQFLTFKNVIKDISFFMQLIQVLIPLYPHLQYSFMLQQQIGIISKQYQDNTNNLRIELLQGYQNYNFQFFEDLNLIQSDNQNTQNNINFLMMITIALTSIMSFRLVCLALKQMLKVLWIYLFQDQSFIVACRLASIYTLFTIVSILIQMNIHNIQWKELILVSINLIFLTIFMINQITNLIQILKQKELNNLVNNISQQTTQILNNGDIKIQNRQIRIMMQDITIKSGHKYFIWILCEIRKIFTIILLEQISSKINLFVTGGIQIVFGSFLLFGIFDTQQKQFYCLITEAFIVSIYFLTAISDNSQNQNIQVGLDYSRPSTLDIITIIVIILFQIITILNSSYYYYIAIKQILYKQKENKKNQDKSFSCNQFPQEFNASTIEEILNSNKTSFGLKKKRINKQI